MTGRRFHLAGLPRRLAPGALDLAAAGLWAVLGPNGSGKTSLLRQLAGLDATARAPDPAASFLQAGPLEATDLTGLELVLAGSLAWGRAWGQWTADERQRARGWLTELEADQLAHRPYAQLSLGEKKLCDLARVLFSGRERLYLDEPTANLDLRHRLLFWQLVRRHAADGGLVLAALHDPLEALAQVGHAIVLKAGQVVAVGPLDQTLTPSTLQTVWRVEVEPASALRFSLLKPD